MIKVRDLLSGNCMCVYTKYLYRISEVLRPLMNLIYRLFESENSVLAYMIRTGLYAGIEMVIRI